MRTNVSIMKLFNLLLFAFFISSTLFAQAENQEAAIEAVIMQLFDGMREGDSAKVHAVFYDDVKMRSSFTDKEGNHLLKEGDLASFINAIGTPHDQVWNEVISSIEIKVDDNLAQVWTPYLFYLDDKLLHCGVNAFQLHLTKNGWKIFNLTDTRRRKGCEPFDSPSEKKE